MNVIVFDTETTDVSKWKFCYNVGWIVYDPVADVRLVKRDFVVEQIWHNTELFATAYYATKRPIYIKAMRARQTIMDKWGYIMQTMMRDIKKYEVQCAYAYNSPFDDAVFTFNCDWFKTQNPFDNLPITILLDLLPNSSRIRKNIGRSVKNTNVSRMRKTIPSPLKRFTSFFQTIPILLKPIQLWQMPKLKHIFSVPLFSKVL